MNSSFLAPVRADPQVTWRLLEIFVPPVGLRVILALAARIKPEFFSSGVVVVLVATIFASWPRR